MLRKVAGASLNFLRSRPYVPQHFGVLCQDLLSISHSMGNSDEHLQATMSWLANAQDANQDGGVAAGYSFGKGWLSSYPETTGYIIPTFLDFYHLTREESYLNRAVRDFADEISGVSSPSG